MDTNINLSYVITTFNKLPYLRITLPLLAEACRADEEIVIADGGSTDGTAEFLAQLKAKGKIHHFLSEKDFGEAHGTNKAILLARGKLIKIMTDDDVYSFKMIAECKNYMLTHQEIDILGTNGFYYNSMLSKQTALISNDQSLLFKKWSDSNRSFMFTGLGIMFRNKSLALLGLFDPNFTIIDYEYTLRVTSSKAKLAWFTGHTFVNIINPNSNSRRYWRKLYQEKLRLHNFYGLKGNLLNYHYVNLRSKISSYLKKRNRLKTEEFADFDFPDAFQKAVGGLANCNSNENGVFLR